MRERIHLTVEERLEIEELRTMFDYVNAVLHRRIARLAVVHGVPLGAVQDGEQWVFNLEEMMFVQEHAPEMKEEAPSENRFGQLEIDVDPPAEERRRRRRRQ